MKIKNSFTRLITCLVFSLVLCNGYEMTGNPVSTGLEFRQDDKQAAYKEHIRKADKFLQDKNYAAAMFEYEKASELMPYEEYPRLKDAPTGT